jgi:hypothetical protein
MKLHYYMKTLFTGRPDYSDASSAAKFGWGVPVFKKHY